LSSSLLSRNVKVKIYKTIILPFVLYGYGTWSLTLREEYRLRMFKNRALRRIFGLKKDEETGEWRQLHTEGLHSLYLSQNVIRKIKSRGTSRVRSLAEAEDFSSSLCVQTTSEADPAFYPMGPGSPFLGIKHGWGVTLATHPQLMLRSRVSRSYIASPPWFLHGGSGTTLL
jgi:hypothetical protein